MLQRAEAKESATGDLPKRRETPLGAVKNSSVAGWLAATGCSSDTINSSLLFLQTILCSTWSATRPPTSLPATLRSVRGENSIQQRKLTTDAKARGEYVRTHFKNMREVAAALNGVFYPQRSLPSMLTTQA